MSSALVIWLAAVGHADHRDVILGSDGSQIDTAAGFRDETSEGSSSFQNVSSRKVTLQCGGGRDVPGNRAAADADPSRAL